MSLYAVEEIETALDATREFLLPVDWRRWLKLAVVALFAGSSVNVPAFPGQVLPGQVTGEFSTAGPVSGDAITPFAVSDLVVVAVFAAFVLVVGVGGLLLSSLFEFVLLESLVTEEIHIRDSLSRHWGLGSRLFGFRLALALLVSLPLFVVVGVVFAGSFSGSVLLLLGLFLVPLFLLALFVGVVHTVTTTLVAPVMLEEHSGVIAGWRRFWPVLTANPVQFGVFFLALIVLLSLAGIGTGIVTAIVTAFLVVLFGIPVLLLVSVGATPVALGVAGLFALLVLLLLVGVVAILQAVVQTYVRYYALLVLGDCEPELDLIPEQRGALESGMRR